MRSNRIGDDWCIDGLSLNFSVKTHILQSESGQRGKNNVQHAENSDVSLFRTSTLLCSEKTGTVHAVEDLEMVFEVWGRTSYKRHLNVGIDTLRTGKCLTRSQQF